MSAATVGDRLTMYEPERSLASFPHMHEIYASRAVPCGPQVRLLDGRAVRAVELPERALGLVLLQHGEVVAEAYANGAGPTDLLPSFSLAKSVVSTLVATLVRDKLVALGDDLADRVPELRSTAFAGVSVRDALQMRSGVAFHEDYEDDAGDARPFWFGALAEHAHDQLSYVRRLARAHEPGAVFNYAGCDTFALGLLVRASTGLTLSAALSERVWVPAGMEADARFLIDAPGATGVEPAYAGLCARLCDYARFGQLHLDRPELLPAGWVEAATEGSPTESGFGYGYQWWRPDPERQAFTGLGVFGQFLWIDPAADAVCVLASAWPSPGDEDREAGAIACIEALIAEL